MTQAVSEALEKVRKLTRKERAAFVKQLLEDASLDEDTRDSLTVVARRAEPRMRYDDLARELKAKGRIK